MPLPTPSLYRSSPGNWLGTTKFEACYRRRWRWRALWTRDRYHPAKQNLTNYGLLIKQLSKRYRIRLSCCGLRLLGNRELPQGPTSSTANRHISWAFIDAHHQHRQQHQQSRLWELLFRNRRSSRPWCDLFLHRRRRRWQRMLFLWFSSPSFEV